MSKSRIGNFFEDFQLGQVITHATPRTVTAGDVALYNAVYGPRFAVQSSRDFAERLGYIDAPIDDLLVFHIVFGKTVPDISLNAIANLGYAECRFLKTVYTGDTLSTTSEVIGLKENSNRETGVVYVRSTGRNQHGGTVLEYVRWVMVRKRASDNPPPDAVVPETAACVPVERLGGAITDIRATGWDTALSGSAHRWADYQPGERIDHIDGVTVEEAEHQMATRLFQNTAKVHFNQHTEGQGRFGRRLVYGGHIISMARALSFNGLENAFHIAAINGGRHVGPAFAGDTIYGWSEVLAKEPLPGREDFGALRIRTIAVKNETAAAFPGRSSDGYDPAVILDLDYWAVLPR